MELSNFIILSLSFAAASSVPHDYGIKGGASAKSGAVAGAVAFPGTLPVFGGAGGSGAYSGSGSFSKSSASSFASSSAGAFSYGGSGGYGGSSGYGGEHSGATDGTDSGNSHPGAGSAAGAAAGAFASAQAGSNGVHGPGSSSAPCSGNCQSSDQEKQQHGTGSAVGAAAGAFGSAQTGSSSDPSPGSSSAPCTGNCHPSGQEKQQQSNCRDSSCEQNYQSPKCTAGGCSVVSSPDLQSNGQSPGYGFSQQNGSPKSFSPVDPHDRPGKIVSPGSNKVSYPGKNEHPHSSGTDSSLLVKQPCSSPECGSSSLNGPESCSSSECGHPSPSTTASCSSPGCITPTDGDAEPASPNSKAQAHIVSSNGYGNIPQVNPDFGRTPILNPKPNSSHPEENKEHPYSGGFGGPPGILNPNEYSVVPKPGQPSYSYDSSSAGEHGRPHGTRPQIGPYGTPSHHTPQGSAVPPATYEQSPHFQNPIQTSHGPVTLKPNVSPIQEHHSAGGHYANPVASSGSFAGASAGATAIAYTGGFGGPPGILKPNDFSLHGLKPGGFTRPYGGAQYPGSYPSVQNQGKPTAPQTGEIPYQGVFGGAPGIIRPNGPSGTGTFPSQHPLGKPEFSIPQQIPTTKPIYECNSGSGPECNGAYYPGRQPEIKPESVGTKHPEKQSTSGCENGSGCGVDKPYHGSFGGAPGIIRPTGTTEAISPYPGVQPEQKPESVGTKYPDNKPNTSGCGHGYGCGVDKPYHGSFGGAPGIFRPTGTTEAISPYPGVQPEQKPESVGTKYPDNKPNTLGCVHGYGCGVDKPYHGSFGGAPGIIRPTGTTEAISQYPGVQPEQKPESVGTKYPDNKPNTSGCGHGYGCGVDKPYHGSFGGAPGIIRPTGTTEAISPYPGVQPEQKPESVGTKHPDNKPNTLGCVHGYGCGVDKPYHGSFGGAPGIIRPTGTTEGISPYPGVQPEQKPESVGTKYPDIKPNTSGCGHGSGCGVDKPYHGSFGGAPGIIRPIGTTEAISPYPGVQPEQKPESVGTKYPDNKPNTLGCVHGYGCGIDKPYHGSFGGAPDIIRPTGDTEGINSYPGVQQEQKPVSLEQKYPEKPGASSCGQSSGCGVNKPDHESYGGTPSITRPTGSAEAIGKHPEYSQGKPDGSKPHHGHPENPDYGSGQSVVTSYETEFGLAPGSVRPAESGNGAATGAGAFAGAVAGAVSGAIGGHGAPTGQDGYGGQQGGHGGQLEGYSGQQGGLSRPQAGYGGHHRGYGRPQGVYGGQQGGYGSQQGDYGGYQGGYDGHGASSKHPGSVKGCSGGCGGGDGVKGGNDIGSYGAGNGDSAGVFGLGGALSGALAGAKSLAGSFGLAAAGAATGALAGAGSVAGAGAGAAAGGEGGHYGHGGGGSFASAQASASASAKSYGGYH